MTSSVRRQAWFLNQNIIFLDKGRTTSSLTADPLQSQNAEVCNVEQPIHQSRDHSILTYLHAGNPLSTNIGTEHKKFSYVSDRAGSHISTN